MRITRKMLQRKVDLLNKTLGTPSFDSYKVEGETVAAKGHIQLDHYQPGGAKYTWKLEQISSRGFGVNELSSNRMTAQELYAFLDGMLWGLEHAQERGIMAHTVIGGRAVQTAIKDAMEGN